MSSTLAVDKLWEIVPPQVPPSVFDGVSLDAGISVGLWLLGGFVIAVSLWGLWRIFGFSLRLWWLKRQLVSEKISPRKALFMLSRWLNKRTKALPPILQQLKFRQANVSKDEVFALLNEIPI